MLIGYLFPDFCVFVFMSQCAGYTQLYLEIFIYLFIFLTSSYFFSSFSED